MSTTGTIHRLAIELILLAFSSSLFSVSSPELLATRKVIARDRTDDHAHVHSSRDNLGSFSSVSLLISKSTTAAATSLPRYKSTRASSAASIRDSGTFGKIARNVSSSRNSGELGRLPGNAKQYAPNGVTCGCRLASATKSTSAVSSETFGPR